MNSWKEQFDKQFDFHHENYLDWRDKLTPEIKHFISTQIIEKLIEDIPGNVTGTPEEFYCAGVKQHLINKWLGQKSEPKPRPMSKELKDELNRAEFESKAFDKGW